MPHRRLPPPEANGGQNAPHTQGGLATAQHRNFSEAIRNAIRVSIAESSRSAAEERRYLCRNSFSGS